MSTLTDAIARIAQSFNILNEDLGTTMSIKDSFIIDTNVINLNLYKFKRLQQGHKLPNLFDQLIQKDKCKLEQCKKEERRKHNERVKKAYYSRKDTLA